MTEQQKDALKAKIASELERLVGEIARLEEITRPIIAEDMDDITRMNAIVNKSVNQAALSTAKARYAGLEYAVKHLETPEFGYCRDCGEPIAFARLLAMPEAVLCIECAS